MNFRCSARFIFNVLLLSGSSLGIDRENDGEEYHYPLDVSFPIQKGTVSTNYAWLPHNIDPENNPVPPEFEGVPVQHLGDRQEFYAEFIQGCRDFYGDKAYSCDQTEYDRVEMSVRQPQSMQNYTDTGFKKIRAPDKLMKIINNYWEKNKEKQKQEKWPAGNTYTNHWAAPTKIMNIEDNSLRGGGYKLKNEIWDAARETIGDWTGQEVTPTSLYGIRVYTEGAVLSPHVDRLPLVSSAIVNVAQDVDEDWPLEVYGRDNRAYNVTMKPGDMVLYESHSLIHGRPFPLKGRYFANIFIHFEPRGHSLRHDVMNNFDDVHQQYRQAAENGVAGHEASNGGLPIYVMENSPEAERWYQRHPQASMIAPAAAAVARPEAHYAAATGNVKRLAEIASEEKNALHRRDSNGWTPIHEAARGGHVEVVEFLILHGANVNERSNYGMGGTPLYFASAYLGDSHPLVSYLSGVGALNVGPEL